MKNTLAALAIALAFFTFLSPAKLLAQAIDTTEDSRQERIKQYYDSIEATIKYQTGKVALKEIASLDIPTGYKFIPQDKANMIIHDLWGNPGRNDILGMVVKADYKLASDNTWAFVVSYDEDGYVKDEDADKINYDDMLKEMQKDEEEINKERAKQGYEAIHFINWAQKPFYDKERKILHWAKSLRFGDKQGPLTLNYDVRILGRKGILSLNAVGTVDQLGEINNHIADVLNIAKFGEGNKYSDFNPSIDKVAAYTIGGLIAGKLIAKTGLIILLLKNIKLIMIAMMGGFAAFRKKIAGLFTRKKKEAAPQPDEASPVPQIAPTLTHETTDTTPEGHDTTNPA